jgi:hypothetical protein
MGGERLALLVAADQFADPQLSALKAPQADIDALAEVLSDPDVGGFSVERLVNCTSQDLRLALHKLFSHRDPDDFCLFHVSSHGLKDAAGELYLATSDTRREYLEATSVEASYLRRRMDQSRAGAIVVLLDCCYGGAFERGMAVRGSSDVDLSGALVPTTEGRGRAVITASTAIEYAFEGTTLLPGAELAPSVFTEAVVSGIRRGSADPDRNGMLTLSELFTFVSRRVRQRSANQTPQWWLYGMSGDLVIARNPNPVVVAKDLPAEVVEVLRLPQPAARLGAVFALRNLVEGTDAGAALGAYRMLETLAADDSRRMSTAATEVLAGVHVDIRPQTVDFGTVAVGEQTPPVILQLEGVLAPACQLTVGDAPVEPVRRGSRVELRLDTSDAAEVDGTIEIVGPGGGASVRVLARIIAEADRAVGPDGDRVTGPGASARPSAAPSLTHAAIDEPTGRPTAGPTEAPGERASTAETTPSTPPARPAQPARSRARSKRWQRLLIALWAATIGTLVAGFVHGNYSDDNWYDYLDPYVSVLSEIATPVAVVMLQLAHQARWRMASGIATAGTGAFPAVLAAALMGASGIRQELAIEFVGAVVITVLASILAFWAGQEVAAEPARAPVVTTVLLGIIAVAATVLTVVLTQEATDSPIFPLLVGVSVGWALLAVGLLLPLRSRARIALGALTVGLLGTIALCTLGPDLALESFVTACGSVIVSVVAVLHVRPFWRALCDNTELHKTDVSDPNRSARFD